MKKAIKCILRDTSDRFYRYQDKVLDFTDPEDLHQMRVAGRTLLSYFSLLADKEEAARPGFIKLRGSLKDTMSLLGEIRDLDVLIDALKERSMAMEPGQAALISGLLSRMTVERVRLRQELASEMPNRISPRWKERMDSWIRKKTPELADRKSIEEKVATLRKKKDKALAAISEYPEPDMANEEFLNIVHRGRISVKKLRYALAILKKINTADKAEIEALKTLQDQLGHVQDMRVWAGLLHEQYGRSAIVEDIVAQWRAEMNKTLAETGLISLGPVK
ncbi:MAG TPA: CHAD domain-containing protein [Methanocella sp.]|uniref:CHAD domain-containing protein n=1 Tax=Methanocella sp. TaxID=2052833 RepID=UPI002BEF0676|nr:CHAD domain-containing protein [Methanocella sp.]HTY92141.1 CHAD domain-containing protein [Methanocella sp.]